MATQELNETLFDAVERELVRSAYPEDLPVLPELPAGRYCDPEFHKLELQHVFRKTWLYAGHLTELPRSGAYKLFEKLDLSIIISRGADDKIRAFKNTCSHRGAALVTQQQGVAKRFICPYHAWGFSSEGELKSVPEAHNFACLNKADKPLQQVRCETWRNMVFINLDENAGPLADFIAPVDAQVGGFPLEELEVKDVIRIEIDCNWKTAYDNFLEIYHVATVHPTTLSPVLNSKTFVVTPLPHGHARFTTRKKGGDKIYGSDVMEDVNERFKSLTVGLPRFPNGFTALDSGGISWMNFWPAGHDKMVIETTLMGKTLPDPEEDAAYWAGFRQFQEKVLSEDVGLFTSIQRSMRTGDLAALVLSCQEQHLQWYNEHIDRLIGHKNIPAHLRMDPVMSARLDI